MKISNGCVYGKVGFSVTDNSIYKFFTNISLYCIDHSITTVLLGHDSSNWAELFTNDTIIQTLRAFNLKCVLVNHPVLEIQMAWLATELNNSKSISVYISSDNYSSNILSVHLKDSKGVPFNTNTLDRLLNYPPRSFSIDVSKELNPIDRVDLSGYVRSLVDSSLVSAMEITIPMYVDCMFGPFGTIVDPLLQLYSTPTSKNKVINKHTSNIRFKYYNSTPTGGSLKQMSDLILNQGILTNNSVVTFGVNNRGSIGVWDLRQNIEISPSGVFIILLHLFHQYNKKGTVLISKALSDRVKIVSDKLKFKTKLVDSGLDTLAKEVAGKRSPLMYGDELGRFWFKGDSIGFNPTLVLLYVLEACSTQNKIQSPGEILDFIYSTLLDNKYVYKSMIYLKGKITKKSVISSLLESVTTLGLSGVKKNVVKVESGDVDTLRVRTAEGDIKISIKEDALEDTLEFYVESTVESLTISSSELVQVTYKELLNV